MTPTEVAEGYEKASKKVLEILPTLSCGKVNSVHDKEAVMKAIRPALMSKQYGCEEFLAKLVVDACSKKTTVLSAILSYPTHD